MAGGRGGSSGPWGIRAQPQCGAHLFHSRVFRGSQVGSVGTEKEKPGGLQGAGFGLWEKEPGWVGASGRVRLRNLPAGREDPKARGRGGRRAAGCRLEAGVLAVSRIPAPPPPLGTAPPGPGPPRRAAPSLPGALPSLPAGSEPGLRPRCHVTEAGPALGAPRERRPDAHGTGQPALSPCQRGPHEPAMCSAPPTRRSSDAETSLNVLGLLKSSLLMGVNGGLPLRLVKCLGLRWMSL